jgi:hypothetical protein
LYFRALRRGDLEGAPVQDFILHENITRFRRLLAEGNRADKRAILNRLLAEEEARLADFTSGQAPHPPQT